MDVVDNISAARVLIRILKFVGLWRWQQDDESSCIKIQKQLRAQRYYFGLLHGPLTFTLIALMWLEVFHSRDLEEAGNGLYISLTEVALVVKIVNISIMGAEAWQFMHEVGTSAEFSLRTHEERKLWRREQRKFEKVLISYIGGSLVVGISAYGSVLFLKSYELPFPYYVPFEWRNVPNYWYAYVYDVVAMTLTCVSNSTLDMMCCYFAFHLALLYKLLGWRLTALQCHLKEEDVLKELRRIFRLHRSVRRLGVQCESLISAPILVQIILSAFILCFSAYRLQNVRITEDFGQFVTMLQFVGVMILQIYLPCYFANEITINSNHLTTCVYNSNWLEFSAPTRKLIIIYMEFLKRPVHIKAGNFFQVGLPIFTKTINNAYSFFALLINIDKK